MQVHYFSAAYFKRPGQRIGAFTTTHIRDHEVVNKNIKKYQKSGWVQNLFPLSEHSNIFCISETYNTYPDPIV